MKLSVSITTYNHQAYIAQAIEGALMQETDFDYEILIGEDDSSDGTREIAEQYQAQYPNRIRLFLNDRRNVVYVDGKPTGKWNLVNNLNNARGEYVALLDGDDYWTSPHKLQQQVDFLDSHPQCTICFHAVVKSYEDGRQERRPTSQSPFKAIYTLDDLLERNFVAKSSVVYRNGLFDDFPEWYYATPTGDWPLHVLNAHHGSIGYINEVMAVHRVHAGSVWSPRSASDRRKDAIRTLEIFRQNLDRKYERKLDESIGRWHWKVLHAMALQKDYRGMGSYGIDLLLGRGGSRAAFVKASGWALQSKIGQRTRFCDS